MSRPNPTCSCSAPRGPGSRPLGPGSTWSSRKTQWLAPARGGRNGRISGMATQRGGSRDGCTLVLRLMQWIERTLLFAAPWPSGGCALGWWWGDLGKHSGFHQQRAEPVALWVCFRRSVFLCRDTHWEIRATCDLQSAAGLGLSVSKSSHA